MTPAGKILKEVKAGEHYDKVFRESDHYRLHYKESSYYVVWTQVLKLASRFADPQILEVGCATGQLARYLHDEGFRRYTGFDFSGEAVRIAEELGPQPFFVGDAKDPNSFNRDYDLVISLEVLEHVDDDFRVLENIRPGTPIIFSLPTFDYETHLRWFMSARQIRARYAPWVEFQEIVPIDRWFVCLGVVSRAKLGALNRLFATREPVTVTSVGKQLHRAHRRFRKWRKRRKLLRVYPQR